MNKIVIDLDGTLTIDKPGPYSDKAPNEVVISKLRELKSQGYVICVYTARNMASYDGNIGQINANTLPIILEWLNVNDVPYDEVIVGKPWCGKDGFYVDDKAIRPSEFSDLSLTQIFEILAKEANGLNS